VFFDERRLWKFITHQQEMRNEKVVMVVVVVARIVVVGQNLMRLR
jgi:hypothetical protein